MPAQVTQLNYPLVKATGFTQIIANEVVNFESGAIGQIISYEDDTADVMLFTKQEVKVGMTVTQTGHSIFAEVYEGTLGSIINPLGQALFKYMDRTKPPHQIYLDLAPAPISQRRRITHQFTTDVSVVDLLLPLGKGQRELIVGDRKTGKNNFLKKIIKAQAQPNTVIIVACIAKRMSQVMELYGFLKRYGILQQTVVVTTLPQDPASLITLTPLTAMSLAEYYSGQGKDVVVILDSMTNHAQFYRQIALLNRKFPGRDSYPGDIFYTHARLLERAGNFVHPYDPRQTVAITCLPLAETSDSDLTDYIISNLISITDGHLLFDSSIFQQGRIPAINTSLSVTRVGKQTQLPLQREINLLLTSLLTQYEKTVALTHFGSDLSEESRQLLSKGQNVVDFLGEEMTIQTPSVVQMIMVALIWNQTFINQDKKAIQKTKISLVEKYLTQAKSKTLFDHLIKTSIDFKTLCQQVTNIKF